MKKDLQYHTLSIDASLKEVLDNLNRGGGIVFIADPDDRVAGIFTDGDTRRLILRGIKLDSPARNHMRENFVFGREGQSKESYLKMLKNEIRHLPILDSHGRLVDLISWAEIWRMPVMEPTLGGNELKYVADCITTNWISSQGTYVTSFENSFADYHQADFAVSCTSGTTALHLALVALGIGKGDEVIVPDLTFGASANSVIHAGANPVFVDVNEEYWNLDPARIEEAITPRTKAIMPVHLYGHPCDMDPVMEIAERRNLYVVEDCAEALGAKYKGQLVGTFGDAACFSFFSNKIITTGEGGMTTVKEQSIYEKMLLWRDHGMTKKKRYWHEVPGFNYRMTNIQAALGLAQLEQVDNFLEHRQELAGHYKNHLGHTAGLTLPPVMDWGHNIYWLYSILIDETICGIRRDELIAELAIHGIESRPFFYPMHGQPPFAESHQGKKFPITDQLASQGISLPTGSNLKASDLEHICEILIHLVKQNSKTT